MLTEYVRIALRRHILRRLNPEGKPPPIFADGLAAWRTRA